MADLTNKKIETAGVVYYTDNLLPEKIMRTCQRYIKGSGLPIVSVSLQPIDFGDNVVLPLERSYFTMFKQTLAGLEKIDTDFVFLCEHDNLYHPSHFQFRPARKDIFYYNQNKWRLRIEDGHMAYHDCKSLSQLCADRNLLIEHYKKRIALVEKTGFSRRMGFEPGTHNRPERVDDKQSEDWRSEFPNLDIRHGKNLTETRWKLSDFNRNSQGRVRRTWQEVDELPGWGKGSEIVKLLR